MLTIWANATVIPIDPSSFDSKSIGKNEVCYVCYSCITWFACNIRGVNDEARIDIEK